MIKIASLSVLVILSLLVIAAAWDSWIVTRRMGVRYDRYPFAPAVVTCLVALVWCFILGAVLK